MQWEKLALDEIQQALESATGEIQMMRSVMAILSKRDVQCAIEDSKGRLLYLNACALKAMSTTLGECQGAMLAALMGISTGYDAVKLNRRVLRTQRPWADFIVGLGGKGKTVAFTIFKFPIWDGDEDAVVGSIIAAGTRP